MKCLWRDRVNKSSHELIRIFLQIVGFDIVLKAFLVNSLTKPYGGLYYHALCAATRLVYQCAASLPFALSIYIPYSLSD